MRGSDLQEAIKGSSPTGLEWRDTNEWVSATQLRLAAPLGHLYDYLLASNFLVPMEIPASRLCHVRSHTIERTRVQRT